MSVTFNGHHARVFQEQLVNFDGIYRVSRQNPNTFARN
jgi:hypothetical protein